jgi:hypothetical protein
MAEGSPRGKARMTGAAFLHTVLLGGVGESVHGRLVLPGCSGHGDQHPGLAQASLLRLGFASYLVEMACSIALTALFYDW